MLHHDAAPDGLVPGTAQRRRASTVAPQRASACPVRRRHAIRLPLVLVVAPHTPTRLSSPDGVDEALLEHPTRRQTAFSCSTRATLTPAGKRTNSSSGVARQAPLAIHVGRRNPSNRCRSGGIADPPSGESGPAARVTGRSLGREAPFGGHPPRARIRRGTRCRPPLFRASQSRPQHGMRPPCVDPPQQALSRTGRWWV